MSAGELGGSNRLGSGGGAQPGPVATATYPPRAGRLSKLWYGHLRRKAMGSAFVRPLNSPEMPEPREVLLCLFVPGCVFAKLGHPKAGLVVLFGYLGCAAAAIVLLGDWRGGLAFGVMVSLHAACVTQLIPFYREIEDFLNRVAAALLVLALSFLCYWGIFVLVEKYLFAAYHTPEGIVVMRPGISPEELQRGDIVGYRSGEAQENGYRVAEGVGLAPVIALPGEHVEFFPNHYTIDGTEYPRRPYMPVAGELTVLPNQWLIWPHRRDLAPSVDQDTTTMNPNALRLLLHASLIPTQHLIGRPYRRWFNREQTSSVPGI